MPSRYAQEITRAMGELAKEPRVVFLGQAVRVPGTAMRGTLEDVDEDRLIELPVEEDFQLGMSIGLALHGSIPVSVFPRWNFLLLAANQLVNHLDKLSAISDLRPPPKVIVRTSIGSEHPLDPGPQHKGDFTNAFQNMCSNLEMVRLDTAEAVVPAYQKALERSDGVSTVLVEWGDLYAF